MRKTAYFRLLGGNEKAPRPGPRGPDGGAQTEALRTPGWRSGRQGGAHRDVDVAPQGVGDRAGLLALLRGPLEAFLVETGDHAGDLQRRAGDLDAATLLGVEGDGRGDVQPLGRGAGLG